MSKQYPSGNVNSRKYFGRVQGCTTTEQRLLDFENFMLGTHLRGDAALIAFEDARSMKPGENALAVDSEATYRKIRKLFEPLNWSWEDELTFHPWATSIPDVA